MAVVSAIGLQDFPPARPMDSTGMPGLFAHGKDATGDRDAMPGLLRRMELMEGALDKMAT